MSEEQESSGSLKDKIIGIYALGVIITAIWIHGDVNPMGEVIGWGGAIFGGMIWPVALYQTIFN